MSFPPQHLYYWVHLSATENPVFRTFEEIFQNAWSIKNIFFFLSAENIDSGMLVTFDHYPQVNANEQKCQSYWFLLTYPKGQPSLQYTVDTSICKCWTWTIQTYYSGGTQLYFYVGRREWVLAFPHSNGNKEGGYNMLYFFILRLSKVTKALCCTFFLLSPTEVYSLCQSFCIDIMG